MTIDKAAKAFKVSPSSVRRAKKALADPTVPAPRPKPKPKPRHDQVFKRTLDRASDDADFLLERVVEAFRRRGVADPETAYRQGWRDRGALASMKTEEGELTFVPLRA
jgi:hypothetical protein